MFLITTSRIDENSIGNSRENAKRGRGSCCWGRKREGWLMGAFASPLQAQPPTNEPDMETRRIGLKTTDV